MKPTSETEVLVVGGGPVGLLAGLALAERGHDVQILDKDWVGSAHSYALALHPASLELLDRLGLARDLISEGQRVDRLAMFQDGERLGEFDLTKAGGTFPFVLVLPQSRLEGVLEDALKRRKVRVLWNHQLMGLESDGDAVTAQIARMDKVSLGYPVARTEWVVQKRFTTRCRFVIGADGYHSFTRKALGVRYEDLGHPETFEVFEFESSGGVGPEVQVAFHGATTNVLWPMKGGRGRWSFQVDRAAQEPLTLATLQEHIRTRAPRCEFAPSNIDWATTTLFERRLAERFGRGRIWLAGDAAHITGPAGVQSMNVGLREAHDLAERMHGALTAKELPDALESYNNERCEEWRALLGSAEPAVEGGSTAWSSEVTRKIVACLPASGDGLQRLLAGVGLRLSKEVTRWRSS